MKAITVQPQVAGSVRLDDLPEPDVRDGDLLVETIAVGVCGTDREIIDGAYGEAVPGRDRLVLGHESLGRVIDAPAGNGLVRGDLVVAIVRRPDPVPCASCAVGEWDMCRNGQYTEHGIKGLDGFCRERFRVSSDAVVRVDRALGIRGVLLEPTSIVAKGWMQIDRIGARANWTPRRALIVGAGPVGLLAALLGVQRGLEVHVADRIATGRKPEIVSRLGATYHTGPLTEACPGADVVFECTGASAAILDAVRCIAPAGIVCLTGVAAGHAAVTIDTAKVNNALVLDNNVIFGTVNANREHYAHAAESLAASDGGWLDSLITRRVSIDAWREAYQPAGDDIKTIVVFHE
jgi:threonine dehydrogenase-like Zn-dependent dehydrogenase